ncbi:MAG: PilW family protein [Gammaproteobacteria bacterium]
MKEKGFTLIELMIAVVLGLLLIAGTLAVFISTKQGYRLENGLSLMQATGRATLDLLAREVMMAGFPQIDDIETFIPAMTTDGGSSNSDQFAVRYQSDTDCLNDTTPVYADGDRYAKNMFFIQNNNLWCRTLAEDDSTIREQAVVQGVENMQLLYGEDNTDDGVSNATRYVTAGNVTDWDNVVSVRIGIIVNSQSPIATSDDTVTYTLFGQTPTAAGADHMRRRAYITTAVIRNRMQQS